MKPVDQWFSEYGECHQNPKNKAIHWVCVPLITACVIALLWDLPRPQLMQQHAWLNWGTVVITASLLFYLRLSVTLAIGMSLATGLIVAGIIAYERLTLAPVYQLALVVFVVAWIGQFVGHSIEGRKPSFFNDIQFLLIGPIWLLGFVYRRIGIPY
jgi:uncharacterized membrane protein YGL010W